ncbi:MAG: AGE family epimerase/isomerase [Propionicimonas sp.]
MPSAPHSRWLESETDRLLRFARYAYREAGGFGILDSEGSFDPEAPADLLITCRMTHVFSIAALLGRGGGGLLADHGLRALSGILRDQEHGGWFRSSDPVGDPGASRKEAYAHAFVLLAFSSATAAGRDGARELLNEATEVIERHFWSEDEGRSLESWDAGFTQSEDYRGANSNMHSVEAYLAVADATGDRVWLQRALRIAEWLINRTARGNGWRIVEHFDGDGRPDLEYNLADPAHQYRPYGATIGHAFEWSRLLLQLRAELASEAPDWLLEASEALYWTAVQEGWRADGAAGFVYTTDWQGKPVVRARLHWVMAEAIAASAALASATSNPEYAVRYRELWDHAALFFFDLEKGSWHHELDVENRPSASVWAGKPDIYHALQCTLIPRLPLAPSLSFALRDGLLDRG